MGLQRPVSVSRAIQAQVALLVVGALMTLLVAVRRNALLQAWTERQTADVDPPAFVPVAIVLFGTFALLVAVLVMFFRDGHPAARASLVGLAAFFLFTMYVLVQQRPPVEFVVVAVVASVLDVVLVFWLLHKDTSAFLRGAELASEHES